MRHLCVLAVALTALVTVVSGARADGSPYAPGLVQGASGALDPSGGTRYVTLATARSTVVAAIGVRNGLVRRSTALRGFYGVPIIAWDGSTGGVSGDGRTLTLASYGPLPGDVGVTRFVLLRTRTLRKTHAFALQGSWAFDAISPDGSKLYLVEYLSAGNSPHYRVRSLTTSTGRLDPEPIVDRREAEVAMRGQPVTRRTSRDGRWAYTLYARGREPFVHALDTVEGEAYCIDLPIRLRQLEQMGLRLRVGAHDRLDVRRGRVTLAVVDTEKLVLRSVRTG
jgi:hypothetical protein